MDGCPLSWAGGCGGQEGVAQALDEMLDEAGGGGTRAVCEPSQHRTPGWAPITSDTCWLPGLGPGRKRSSLPPHTAGVERMCLKDQGLCFQGRLGPCSSQLLGAASVSSSPTLSQ